jgi:uncharacterized protein
LGSKQGQIPGYKQDAIYRKAQGWFGKQNLTAQEQDCLLPGFADRVNISSSSPSKVAPTILFDEERRRGSES